MVPNWIEREDSNDQNWHGIAITISYIIDFIVSTKKKEKKYNIVYDLVTCNNTS